MPADKVAALRIRSFAQLRWFFDQADRAWVFDNSLSEPQLVDRKGDGGITIRAGLPPEIMDSLI